MGFSCCLAKDHEAMGSIRGVGADDVKEVREIVQHLFTNIAKPARSK